MKLNRISKTDGIEQRDKRLERAYLRQVWLLVASIQRERNNAQVREWYVARLLRLLDQHSNSAAKDGKAFVPASAKAAGKKERPSVGTIQYFKKTGSKRPYDVMRATGKCMHSKWQRAGVAPKAEKGIARIAGYRYWRKLEKCRRCTGGGFWRVTW
jgi:hypothetical protein